MKVEFIAGLLYKFYCVECWLSYIYALTSEEINTKLSKPVNAH